MKFSRDEEREPRDCLLSVRVKRSELELLDALAEELQIEGGRAEMVRRAIDFWVETDRAARQAAQRLQKRQ